MLHMTIHLCVIISLMMVLSRKRVVVLFSYLLVGWYLVLYATTVEYWAPSGMMSFSPRFPYPITSEQPLSLADQFNELPIERVNHFIKKAFICVNSMSFLNHSSS